MSNLDYNNEVSTWLKSINPGWRIIDDICRPENKGVFIDAVKAYINDNGHDVYFSSEYKKIRKIEIPEFLTNKKQDENRDASTVRNG